MDYKYALKGDGRREMIRISLSLSYIKKTHG
jgi:hypothetical protein